jgi:murein DD-endopeptidase MepM/ murein hydrolase activator NlpD
MAISGWGGTNAFIAEGLRRAEEERKRKEEEERKRLEEERRRQEEARRRSLIPPIRLGDANLDLGKRPIGPATKEESSFQRPIKGPEPGPLLGITNPFRADTSTPQIAASQPTQQTQTIAPLQSVMSEPAPSPVDKSVGMPNPRRQQVNAMAALNTGPPTLFAQSPVPGMVGNALSGIIPEGGVPSFKDMWTGVANAALDIPILGDALQGLARPLEGMMPDFMQKTVTDDVKDDKNKIINDAMARSQGVNNPLEAVVDRYRYNLIDAPRDATDQVLKTFAPFIYAALKATEAIGGLDELSLSAPNLGAVLGDHTKSLGESWGVGWRAKEIYDQQYSAYLTGQEWQQDGEWWKFNPLQGTPVKQPVSRPDMVAALALGTDEYEAALAPTGIEQQSAAPGAIVAAQSYAKTMAHHGIPVVAQMFDDILDNAAKATQLRDEAMGIYQSAYQMPPGPDREKVLWRAADLGAKAQHLAQTHPAQLYDENANWWMALPAELMLGITNLADIGMDIAKLKPAQRRMKRAADLASTTVDQAMDAMITGNGRGASWEQQLKDQFTEWADPIPLLRDFWQTNGSQAMVDARNNFRTLTSILHGFTTKEDVAKIATTYALDPMNLLTNGIPASELTSPGIQWAYPQQEALVGPMQNVVRFGPANFGSYDSIQSHGALAPIADAIASLPSLQGTGQIDPGRFASELYTLLTRGAADTHGVATMPDVPAGTKTVSTRILDDGTAVVQYFADGRKLISESTAYGIGEANKVVRDLTRTLKSGAELATNYIQAFGNAQRSLLGITTVNFGLGNVINDGISNRLIPFFDGVWGWKGKNGYLAYIQGVSGGTPVFDEIARQVTDIQTNGGISSQFAQGVNNIPVIGQVQQLRQWDDRNVRTVVYGATHESYMNDYGVAQFKPAVENMFKEWGWTDNSAIKNATASVWDAGIRGGWNAAVNTFYQIANGTNLVSAASISPIYRDVFGTYADRLDALIKGVTPETVQQGLTDLEKLRAEASGAMSNFSAQYLNSPSRTQYTRLEDQKNLAEIESALKTTANVLGEDYATGVKPYLDQIGEIQKNINANILQVTVMSQASPNAAGHIWSLLDQVTNLRTQTQHLLTQLGNALIGNTRGMLTPEKQEAYREWRRLQEAHYANLNFDVGKLVEETRLAIANGTPFTGAAPIIGALESLGADIQNVFYINEKLKPQSFKRDPNAKAAEEAGRKGTESFITQMMMLLQANPTQTGLDHYTAAIDNVAEFYWRTIPEMQGKFDEIVERAKLLTEGSAEWKRIEAEYGKAYDERNKAWVKYYEYAYARYQAASALIAQAAGGVTALPVFQPTGRWGIPSWGETFTVTLEGFNPRNKKQVLIRRPDGKVQGMDIKFVPPDILKQWQDMSANLYGQLAQQVGKIGAQLFDGGTGAAVIDGLISGVRNGTKNPIFDAVRKDMENYAANPTGYGDLGSDMTNWLGRQINSIAAAAAQKLPQIAEANVSKTPPLSLDAVRQFSTNVKPIWDNILTGANQAAEEMVGFSLVDFIRTYGSDILTGALVPYAYWATRQGKNMLERMMFSPRAFGLVAGANRVIQGESNEQGLPQRYNNAINTGITLPNDELWMIQSPLPRWAPFGLKSIFNGWGDADRAAQGMELLVNQMEANGFPGWQGAAGAAMVASEVASASGFSQYPWYRDVILAMNGRSGEISLSNYGFLGQIIGNVTGAYSQEYQPGVVPFYQPYKVARDLANQQFGIDESAKIPMAAGQAQFEERPLDPTFAANYPQAGPEWEQAYREQSLEDLIALIFKMATSLSASSMDPKEIDRLKAQQHYTRMGYSPDNPTGSRERTQAYDEQSPNYVPGLSAGQSTYGVVGEGPMRDRLPEDEESRPIDEGVLLGEYLDKRDAIYDKYKQEEVAKINANPQWTGEKIAGDRSDWYGQFYDAREAELKALDGEYPSIAGNYAEFTEDSLRGANPLEVTDAALKQLIIQAKEENESLKPGDFPENGTREEKNNWYKQQEAYDQAVSTRLQELMNDPAAASKAVFDSPLLGQGADYVQQQGDSAPANVAGSAPRTATVGQQQTTVQAGVPVGSPSVDPNNQWAQQMAEAEKTYGLPPGLLQEVARGESSFNPDAKSDAGAMGLLQIMPDTWDEWAPKVGATDPWNPEDSIKVAAAYLGWLKSALPEGQNDTVAIMTAYNWGIGNVLNKGVDAAPPETKAYSSTIATALDGPTVMSAPQAGGTQKFIRPVQGGSELVTQGYGANVEDYAQWNGPYGHEGVDYGVPVGTPVMASANGTVVFVGTGDGFENYGNYVVIQHPDGYKSYYAHLSEFDAQVGDVVEQGQVIAKSGNTGRSSGPHLHFSLRLDGDETGPYGMVNPTDFILGRDGHVAPAQVAQAPANVTQPTQNTIASDTGSTTGDSVSVTIGPKVAKPATPTVASGRVDWGVGSGSAEEVLAREEIKHDSPEKIALDQSIDDAWTHSYDRIAKAYPGFDHLFDEYRGVNDENRESWRNANPMIRALNLLVYNEVEHDEAVKLFGKSQVEKWAAIPRGENIGEAAGDYYRANPGVFETKAWIQGRPKPFDADTTFDPEQQAIYDFGKDYQTAKDMFGDNIWQVVNEYYTIPKYVQGGDNSAWIAFKEKYPQYDQWRVWWYALMGNQQQTGQQYGGFHPRAGYGNGFSSGRGSGTQIRAIDAMRMSPPQYRPQSDGGGDWRKYFDPKVGIPNPNRK